MKGAGALPGLASGAVDPSRRLCIFFEAGGTRFLVEAVRVTEVAHAEGEGDTVRGHLGARDLSALLGGEAERRPGNVVVLDTSPTAAVRVAAVEGVFDAAGDAVLPLPRRLIPLVSPAIRGALLREGRLSFELDADGVARGLPRHTRRRERFVREPLEPCLVFESGGARFAVPLSHVLQVVAQGPHFNPAPSRSEFLGAVAHQQRLHPVFSVSEVQQAEPLIVLVDARAEPVGLSAARALGVQRPDALGDAQVLDVERMFS